MKVAEYTHRAFDGVTLIKGWVIEDNYGNLKFVYYNGVNLCEHDAIDWELEEIK